MLAVVEVLVNFIEIGQCLELEALEEVVMELIEGPTPQLMAQPILAVVEVEDIMDLLMLALVALV